jgi:hypothetical protein
VQSLMKWVEALPLAVLIHQKAWLFTTIQIIHVVAISIVIGSIAVMDLRLLGVGSRGRLVTEIAREVLPVTWVAFVIAALAGSLMFISQATAYYMNTTFWVKMGIMLLAGINMAVFELITVRGVQTWDVSPAPPLPARVAGGVSLMCWLLVFVFGRWTSFTIMPS